MQKSLAFIFPGQGSQSQGMLTKHYQTEAIVRDTLTEASDALGYDLWQLIQDNPADKLNQTEYTQPALLATSVALWRLWCAKTAIRPAYFAGHSLGEYSALVCADSLTLADGVRTVALRGQLMQAAVAEGTGAMAAIVGLSDADVADVCAKAAQGDVVVPANYNAPGQVVISGHATAVQRAVELAKNQAARLAKVLPVSVPSHSPLMKPAAEKLSAALALLPMQLPHTPILHNIHANIEHSLDGIRAALTHQLSESVRWVDTISKLSNVDVTQLVECGPGKVLAGLTKRFGLDLVNYVSEDPVLFADAITSVETTPL
jgi:[acyl-carrier-protein] S-malonyltransferase